MARKKSTAIGIGIANVNAADNAVPLSESFKGIEQSEGRTAAMQYLKERGVTWKETKHAGINWMRACMAANKAFV